MHSGMGVFADAQCRLGTVGHSSSPAGARGSIRQSLESYLHRNSSSELPYPETITSVLPQYYGVLANQLEAVRVRAACCNAMDLCALLNVSVALISARGGGTGQGCFCGS